MIIEACIKSHNMFLRLQNKRKKEVKRDLITLKIKAYVKQYTGKKTMCPCCQKEYMPKFQSNVKSIINYDEGIKALVVYLNSYCNIPNQKVSELLNLLSNKINMSTGTVENTMKQFNKKSEPIIIFIHHLHSLNKQNATFTF